LSEQQSRLQRRAQRTLSALTEAGLALMGEMPIPEVPIAAITDRADVALGSFYNYFDNRDHLVGAILEMADEVRTNVIGRLVAGADNELERCIARPLSMVHLRHTDPRWAAFVHRAHLAELWPLDTDRARCRSLLESISASGVADPGDIDWATEALIALEDVVAARPDPLPDPATHTRVAMGGILALLGVPDPLATEVVDWCLAQPLDLTGA